jgi:hypothetical protein
MIAPFINRHIITQKNGLNFANALQIDDSATHKNVDVGKEIQLTCQPPFVVGRIISKSEKRGIVIAVVRQSNCARKPNGAVRTSQQFREKQAIGNQAEAKFVVNFPVGVSIPGNSLLS